MPRRRREFLVECLALNPGRRFRRGPSHVPPHGNYEIRDTGHVLLVPRHAGSPSSSWPPWVSSSEEIGKSPDDVSRRDDNGVSLSLSLSRLSLPLVVSLRDFLSRSFLMLINRPPPKLSRDNIDFRKTSEARLRAGSLWSDLKNFNLADWKSRRFSVACVFLIGYKYFIYKLAIINVDILKYKEYLVFQEKHLDNNYE